MIISRYRALQILWQHGWESWDDTSYDPATQTMVPGTSFDAEIGFKSSYTLREVKRWLGY